MSDAEADLDLITVELSGCLAVFTGRSGGVSRPPFDGLNLGTNTNDQPTSVMENRAILARVLDLAPSGIRITHQVHGSALTDDRSGEAGHWLDHGQPALAADGHFSTRPDSAMAVFVADCFPVVLDGPSGSAILHLGWRGVAGELIEEGALACEATEAFIGPGIGPCCFETGPEVPIALGVRADRTGRVDLAGAIEDRLRRTGVKRVEAFQGCTCCQPERFFSHRRDRDSAGRQCGILVRH